MFFRHYKIDAIFLLHTPPYKHCQLRLVCLALTHCFLSRSSVLREKIWLRVYIHRFYFFVFFSFPLFFVTFTDFLIFLKLFWDFSHKSTSMILFSFSPIFSWSEGFLIGLLWTEISAESKIRRSQSQPNYFHQSADFFWAFQKTDFKNIGKGGFSKGSFF